MPRLTEAFASTIVVPPGQREVFVFDGDHRDAVGGFFFRKFADTGRTFAGVKFTANGKQRRLSLGEVTQGTVSTYRRLAAEAKARARLGQDVLEERQKARATNREEVAKRYNFGSAVTEYLLARERGIGPTTGAAGGVGTAGRGKIATSGNTEGESTATLPSRTE